MTQRKDLYNLHCRVKHSTADRLKSWSEELGHSVGEMIDLTVEGYEKFCDKQDVWLEKSNIYDLLGKLLEKVEKIEQIVGGE